MRPPRPMRPHKLVLATIALALAIPLTGCVPSGVTGPAGSNGAAGEQGPTGAAGSAGSIGSQGAPGVPGPAGLSGSAGPAGPAGQTGVTGPAGPGGPTGFTGPAGPSGVTGPVGATGQAGATGAAGAAGPTGSEGPVGPEGAAGSASGTVMNGWRGTWTRVWSTQARGELQKFTLERVGLEVVKDFELDIALDEKNKSGDAYGTGRTVKVGELFEVTTEVTAPAKWAFVMEGSTSGSPTVLAQFPSPYVD